MKRYRRLGLPDENDTAYWGLVRARAHQLGTDGCTGVLDIYVDSCYEHDIHCRTHKTVYGVDLSSKDAARIFRERIQGLSWLNGLTPLAWWRWAGVRFLGPQWNKGDPAPVK